MKLTICNLSIFSLMVPFFISCGNAVDNKRKLPKANETVNLPKQEVPNQQINEFEKKISDLIREKDELISKIALLENNLKDVIHLNSLHENEIREFIIKINNLITTEFKIKGDEQYNQLITLLDKYNSKEKSGFEYLFSKISEYCNYFLKLTYKNKLNNDVSNKIHDFLNEKNKLLIVKEDISSVEQITLDIIRGNIQQIFDKIDAIIKKLNSQKEDGIKAENEALKESFLKILLGIKIDGENLFSEEEKSQLKMDIEKPEFSKNINLKISKIIDKIKQKNMSDILTKLSIPKNEHKNYNLNNFADKINEKFKNDFKKKMIDYLISINVITNNPNKKIYTNEDFKKLQEAIYDPKSNYSAEKLYQLIVDHLLLISKIKDEEINKLKKDLSDKKSEINSINARKSIYSQLEAFPGIENVNCLDNGNKELKYNAYNDHADRSKDKPYLIEISSIDENKKDINFKASHNRINQCINNKQIQTVDNKIINIEFFKYHNENYNDAFIVHIEDDKKREYSFYFPNNNIYEKRYTKLFSDSFIDNKSSNFKRYSADRYTILDKKNYALESLINDKSNQMHSILFSRYFSDQITHGHSASENKFSHFNDDNKYEFWLVKNNDSLNNDQLFSAKKYMKIEISKEQKIFKNSTSTFVNACFYSKINSKLVTKCFNEDFGEHLELKLYFDVLR
nr:hypothetical protein GTC16762_26870 [Pigmentibacter ruber]